MKERFLDVFRGNPKERRAKETIGLLKSLPKLSPRNVRELERAEGITRRLFLRKAAVLIGGSVVLAGTGKLAFDLVFGESPEVYEETYTEYLNAFESVVVDDVEAKEILNFFKERRKRGYLKGNIILSDEEADADINFYTVIADPNKNREAFNNFQGVAEFNNQDTPTRLMLKKIPIDNVWAGAILAHEAFHVYQWLSGIEPNRADGFMLGEQEAYEFEIRLLDRQTSGKLKEIAKRRAVNVADNSYRGRLSPDDLKEFSSLFNPAKSLDEEGARVPIYIIALNYAVAESRAQTPEEAKKLKTEYIRDIFEGRIPLLG